MPKTGPSTEAAQTESGAAIARDFAVMRETPLLRFSGAQEAEGRAVKELTARPSKATILYSGAQALVRHVVLFDPYFDLLRLGLLTLGQR